MTSNMRTGTKVLLGFALAVLVSVVVGLVGYHGIDALHVESERLSLNLLPTVDLIREGQFEMGYGVSGLINHQMMDPRVRKQQYRHAEQGQRNIEEGKETYEALPKGPEEAAVWRQAQPLIEVLGHSLTKVVALEKQKDGLLAAGARQDDPKVRDLESQAFGASTAFAEAFAASMAKMEDVQDVRMKHGSLVLAQARAAARTSRNGMLVAIVLGALGLAVFGMLLARTIARSLRVVIAEVGRMNEAAVDGHLDTRADPQLATSELRPIVVGVNATLDALVTPLQTAAGYVDRIAKGDIPARITADYRGDFHTIKDNLNTCIDNLNALISEMRRVSHEHDLGENDATIPAEKFQGAYRAMAEGVNGMVAGHIDVNAKAMACVAEFGRGNFEAALERFPGKKACINATIEQVRANLKALIVDADMLSTAAVEGMLRKRADPARHHGDFRKIVDGVNRTLDCFLAPINEASQVLEKLARRDLRARATGDYRGDHALIKRSLNQTAQALDEALSQVAEAVDQVSSAAGQIAATSQSLADGACGQASSLEETSSSLAEMSSLTQRSAEIAGQASGLAQVAKGAAEGGAVAVKQMTAAMGSIKASAQATSQIIKDINEIAFQTNLLALNAAVEAARAGEAGRGFAVVAEEVRSLALRSKEAATKTEGLIKESVRQASEGEVTSKQVSTKLVEIVTGIEKVSEIVTEISGAARIQSNGVDQINKAVSDVNGVTQENAASSEESSSAAAELSSQSAELASMVASFHLSLRDGRSERAMARSKDLSEGAARAIDAMLPGPGDVG